MIEKNMRFIRFISATKGKKEDTPLYKSTKDGGVNLNIMQKKNCTCAVLSHASTKEAD